jgi:uncharacterized protein YjbI with pentapeptide repeats
VTARVFGDIDGRIDLRGLPLTRLATTRLTAGEQGAGPAEVDGPAWVGLDLTGADLYELNWVGLTVRDCVMDDADIEHLRCWAVTVTDTSMVRAKLYYGQLGTSEYGHRRSRWERVDLRRADLRATTADVEFHSVDLRHAKFRGTDFGWSDFHDCRFEGIVRTYG